MMMTMMLMMMLLLMMITMMMTMMMVMMTTTMMTTAMTYCGKAPLFSVFLMTPTNTSTLCSHNLKIQGPRWR